MKYRFYEATIRWADTGEECERIIATGDEEARNWARLDEQVFYWCDDEPTVGMNLGDCSVVAVRVGVAYYRVTYGFSFVVEALDPEGAQEVASALLDKALGDYYEPTVEELGEEKDND